MPFHLSCLRCQVDLHSLAGIVVAAVAFFINLSVENVAGFKYRVSLGLMGKSTFFAYITYSVINLGLVLFATSIVLWVAPEAVGSGIAEVKVRRALQLM